MTSRLAHFWWDWGDLTLQNWGRQTEANSNQQPDGSGTHVDVGGAQISIFTFAAASYFRNIQTGFGHVT